jgi:hypothetical protein
MSWAALSPRLASTSTAEMGHAASFETPEAPTVKFDPGQIIRRATDGYTVDPDCTGSLFDADGTHSNNIVVFDGGKRFFVLSVAPGTITTEEGTRLESED